MKKETLGDLVRRLDDQALDAAIASARSGDFGAVEARLKQMARMPSVDIKAQQQAARGVALHGALLPGSRLTRRGAGLRGSAASPWGKKDLPPREEVDDVIKAAEKLVPRDEDE